MLGSALVFTSGRMASDVMAFVVVRLRDGSVKVDFRVVPVDSAAGKIPTGARPTRRSRS